MPRDPGDLKVDRVEEVEASEASGVCAGYAPMPEAEALDAKWAEEGRAHLSPTSYEYLLDRFPGVRAASEDVEEVILPLPVPPERRSNDAEALVADMLDVSALESAQDVEARRRVVLPVGEIDELMVAEIAQALEAEGRSTAAGEVAAQAVVSEPDPWYWLPSPNSLRNNYKKYFYSVHSTEGAFSGASSWLRDSRSSASCHPIIPRTGDFSHVLAGDFWDSWTEAVWYYNMHSCSIEMEGYAAKNFWPEEQYDLCAAWGAYYCNVANIPARLGCTYARHSAYRAGIITHNSVPLPSTHTDPGPYFDLEKLERKIKVKLGLANAPAPAPTPTPTPAPDPVRRPPTGFTFVNYVFAEGDGWGERIAVSMEAGMRAAKIPGGPTTKAAKAAADAREQKGVYSFLIGPEVERRAKEFQHEFTDLKISYNTTGSVRVVKAPYREEAISRLTDLCEEKGLDKAAAIRAFKENMAAPQAQKE